MQRAMAWPATARQGTGTPAMPQGAARAAC